MPVPSSSVEGLAEFGGTRRATVSQYVGMVRLELEGYDSGGDALLTPARARALAELLMGAADGAEQDELASNPQ